MLISGAVVGRFIPNAIQAWQALDKDIANDIVAGLSTLYGCVTMGLGIHYITPEHKRLALEIARILLPHPCLFAWLTLSGIRKNPEVAPFAIAGNLFFDIVGYVGGGGALLADTLQNKNKPTIAEV